jgi:4-hydroxy-3-polyprenylbenzoate decarboxylase
MGSRQDIVKKRIIVGISGSSGAIYGVRLIEVLAGVPEIETHVVVSKGAEATIEYETPFTADQVRKLADFVHSETGLGDSIASGTFLTSGMVVAPCSIKTLSSIANAYNADLITRAADVCLKERRKLVLVVRETPLHIGHLRLMTQVTEAGAVVLPPVPGFYTLPATISDIVDHTITKILDQFDLDLSLIPRWSGLEQSS